MELRQWLNVATPLARSIVRNIIQNAHPAPLHTQRIYALTQTVKLSPEQEHLQTAAHARLVHRTGPALPPNPIHPIRSISYLKNVVLEDLAARGEIVKIQQTRPATEQELSLAATIKPPTRSQRKNRGAAGPGRRPVHTSGGMVTEWVWRLREFEDAERERRKAEAHAHQKALLLKKKKEAARIRAEKKLRLRKPFSESQREWIDDQKNYFLPGLSKRT